MSANKLHIVSLDVPFPPDYGGAIDIFYRLKALNELGWKIHLHCFEYGRGEQPELEKYTEKVTYYERKKTFSDWFNKLPFIVQTRRPKELILNLEEEEGTILFEGLHTTFFLTDDRLKNRRKIVRAHNVEHEYYRRLASSAKGWKKKFYLSEAKKLEKYESILKNADQVLAINIEEATHFRKWNKNVSLLPPCFEKKELEEFKETENYVLFHGNLSVEENERAVCWLVQNVFPIEGVEFKVAGRNPSKELERELDSVGAILVSNPTDEVMNELISNARVHTLFSDQPTGVKLKLMYALQSNGHVIVNPTMLYGTDLHDYCTVVNSADEWKNAIVLSLETPLSLSEYYAREKFFEEYLDVKKNCTIITK